MKRNKIYFTATLIITAIAIAGLFINGQAAAQIPTANSSIIFMGGNQHGQSVGLSLDGDLLYILTNGSTFDPASIQLSCTPSRTVVSACGEYVYVGYDCPADLARAKVIHTGVVLPCSVPSVVYIPVVKAFE